MRFLLDQGLPRTAAAILRLEGHAAEHVGDIAFADAGAALDAGVVATAARTLVRVRMLPIR